MTPDTYLGFSSPISLRNLKCKDVVEAVPALVGGETTNAEAEAAMKAKINTAKRVMMVAMELYVLSSFRIFSFGARWLCWLAVISDANPTTSTIGFEDDLELKIFVSSHQSTTFDSCDPSHHVNPPRTWRTHHGDNHTRKESASSCYRDCSVSPFDSMGVSKPSVSLTNLHWKLSYNVAATPVWPQPSEFYQPSQKWDVSLVRPG